MPTNLLGHSKPQFRPLRAYPRVSSNPADIPRTFSSPQRGLDFEWNIRTGRPTIVGFASPQLAVSVPFDVGRAYLREFIERPGRIAGHNLTQAEKPILKSLGIDLPLTKIDDTIILFYLTNAHLCKAEGKLSDADSDYKGRGFMNVWTMLSLYTPFPDHKECPGDEYCEKDRACPIHNPYRYNGLDALEPLHALSGLYSHLSTRKVDHLYPLHVELMDFLHEIQQRGVRVDTKLVSTMREEFAVDKDALRESFAFNVDSPKAAVAYFRERGIGLENWQEETLREACDQYEDTELQSALEYKEMGKGVDSWFAPRVWNEKTGEYDGFVDEEGYAHPRLGPYTSTARLQCTGPNLQNVSKRRIDRKTGEKVGKRVRRCIIPYPGYYFVMADYSNAEGNNMLYQAGEERPEGDFHEAMKERIGIRETDEFALSLGGARDAAKSATHAWNYLEGLSLIDPAQLQSWRIKNEIAIGARIVYRDWSFMGLIVTFTGINFARRAFGQATIENRRKVLEMQGRYFSAFPGLHRLHRRISREVEMNGSIQPPNGYYLLSYGEHEDRLKTAVACVGSQPVAHMTKLAMLKARQHAKGLVVLQIHDELLYAFPRSTPVKTAAKYVLEYQGNVEMPEMPGFRCPVEIAWSAKNWGDKETIWRGGKWLR